MAINRMENTGYRKYFEVSSLIIILYVNGGVSQLLCPNVGELNSTVKLKYTFTKRSDQTYRNPDGDVAAFCSTKTALCGSNQGYKGTVVNMTHSYLEISKVTLSDAGNWTLQDDRINTSCTVVVTKTPSCNITSYRDTSDLYVGDEMFLSVYIQKYYCSRSLELLLVTGNTTHQLIENTALESIQSSNLNSTFILRDSHFGSVEVGFICNSVFKKVPCQGENVLVKQNFACTIIAGDTDRDDEVSLTVDIKEYHCSQPAEFMLLTGSTTVQLNKTHRANGSHVFTSLFNVTKNHLGPVYLIFLCNNVSRRFTCDGVQTLSSNHPETILATTSDVPINRKGSDDSKIVIIAGATAAAVVIIIPIVIIIVYVVKKHCKSAEDNCPCDDVADNVNTRSKTIRVTAYEDIGDVDGAVGDYGYENYTAGSKNDVEMVISGGYMSSDDVKTNDPRTYYSLLPETTLRSEHVYTQFTKNSKVQN